MDTLKADLGVTRTDFEEIKAVVRDLAQAQQRTESRLEELAQAQQRTESRLEELARAQQKTDESLALFRQTFTAQIGGLGAR